MSYRGREVGEVFTAGDSLTVTVVTVRGRRVRLDVDTPYVTNDRSLPKRTPEAERKTRRDASVQHLRRFADS